MEALTLTPPEHTQYDQPFVYDMQQMHSLIKDSMDNTETDVHRQKSMEQMVNILQAVLATEIACMLRYTMNAITAAENTSEDAKKQFVQHGQDEHEHIERVAGRIYQLGGKPDYIPQNLATRAAAESIEAGDLAEMVQENLLAIRIACEHYPEMIAFFANKDPETCAVLEDILVKKEKHADDMRALAVI
jgi:bacterioferritin